MKSIITLSIALCFSAISLKGQNETPKTEYIGGNNDVYTSGFGGIIFQTAFIDGTPTGFFGGGGAVLFDNSFYFGGFGLAMQNDIRVKNIDVTNNLPVEGNLTIDMGGIMLGYMPFAYKKVHPVIGLDFSWGDYTISNINSKQDFYDDSFVGITPRFGFEANALPWLKLNAGLGYRIYTGMEGDYIPANFLNAPLIDFRIMFGWFGE